MKLKSVFLLIAATLCGSNLSGGEPKQFEVAYRQAKSSERPLLVVVGATWCPGCVTLKNETMAIALQAGSLRDVELTYVDVDHQSKIAAKLLKGRRPLPHIMRMDWNGTKWNVKRFPTARPTAAAIKRFASIRRPPAGSGR